MINNCTAGQYLTRKKRQIIDYWTWNSFIETLAPSHQPHTGVCSAGNTKTQAVESLMEMLVQFWNSAIIKEIQYE